MSDSSTTFSENINKPSVVEDITAAEFKAKVLDESASRPVLVDFWAPWCGPCKQLAPALEKVVQSTEGKVKLVKMNIDEHPQIAGQLGIKSIPAVIAFHRGQPADGFMGAVPEGQIRSFIERLVGPIGHPAADLIAAGNEALENGDANQALEAFQSAIEADDSNVDAYAGVARSLIALGELDAADDFIESLTETLQTHPTVTAIRSQLRLTHRAEAVGNLTELEQKVAGDPADHQARYDLALALNGEARFDEAADHLLHIIRAEKNWNDDAARKQLLEFFQAWGLTSEHTNSARRKLSSALYS